VPRVPGDAVMDGAASVARLALYLDGTVETLAYFLAATGDNHKATRVLDCIIGARARTSWSAP
jgi:hypothetical protein